jgi:hypothetical protein
MSKAPRPSAAVTAAINAIDLKERQIKGLEEGLTTMRAELGKLHLELSAARVAEDAHLPQCRVVQVSRYKNEDSDIGMHVIVRQTPTGQIVTRPVGHPGPEQRWKREDRNGVWYTVERGHIYASAHKELRDVPPQYTTVKP